MELGRRTRKSSVKKTKITGTSENSGLTTNTEEQSTNKKRTARQRVQQKNSGRKRPMGAGNSQEYDLTDSRRKDNASKWPVCSPSPKHAYAKGHTNALLQSIQRPTAQFLCGSCLYPCTPDSPTCTNNLCPLVFTLLTCGVVSDPKSNVFGCPEFRACPKCHNLIIHETGCKFVTCQSCKHKFCFICLQDDCKKDTIKYWSLTCKKPKAERQRFILKSS